MHFHALVTSRMSWEFFDITLFKYILEQLLLFSLSIHHWQKLQTIYPMELVTHPVWTLISMETRNLSTSNHTNRRGKDTVLMYFDWNSYIHNHRPWAGKNALEIKSREGRRVVLVNPFTCRKLWDWNTPTEIRMKFFCSTHSDQTFHVIKQKPQSATLQITFTRGASYHCLCLNDRNITVIIHTLVTMSAPPIIILHLFLFTIPVCQISTIT